MKGESSKAEKKSLSDIQGEVSSYIDGIRSEKRSVEQNLVDLSANIKSSFEDAQDQIEQINCDLSRDETELGTFFKSRLAIAASSIDDSVKYLINANKEIKYQYNQLVFPVLLLLGCIIISSRSGYIVSIFPVLGIGIMGFSLLDLILLVIITCSLFLMWKSSQSVESSFEDSYESMNNNKLLVSQQNWKINRMRVHKQKFTNTEPFFAQATGVIDTLIVNIGKSVPLISQAFDELTLLTRYRTLVENFRLALNYYGLCREPDFFTELKQFAPANDHIINDENFWEKSIVDKIIFQLSSEGIVVSQKLILLLFYEHNGKDTRKVFREILNSDTDLYSLSQILITNRIIVDPPPYYQYRLDDIIRTLKSIDAFDLAEINRIVSNNIRLMDYINSYIDFLVKNGINLQFQLTLQYIIDEQKVQTDNFAIQVIDLAYNIGLDALRSIDSLPEDYRHGFANASISLKFSNDLSIRVSACQRSAEDITTAIIRAYYEKSNEFDRAEPVRLIELIQDLDLIKSEYSKRNSDDFKFLKSELSEGKWFDSSGSYLKKFIDASAKDIKEQISEIEKYSILKDVLKDNFQNVNVDSIEKAIDAQIFGAYVIMFDSKRGNLRDLIDSLSIRYLESKDPEKKWDTKTEKKLRDNKERYGITPNYDFISFSPSTRIGVLEDNETFSDFEKSILSDLKIALRRSYPSFEGTKYDIGLIIHKITLSKYCLGLLDDDGISDIAVLKNLDFANYISKLASDHVSPEKQASVLRFEEKVDLFQTIDYKSIYEIIRSENDDLKPEERKILTQNDIKEDILDASGRKLGVNGFRALAFDLNKRISKEQVSKVVEAVLYNRYVQEPKLVQNAKIRAKIQSERFADSFEKLSLLYELQKR
ncbi:hypothetical protein [Methanofollis sp. UBA420]|jgi:hypothetical protein|uniref:hypothetical protein n=1 Tax=Methanofollis sp. UBA420 TaxID=1915514 RepID=UPI00316AE145